MPTILLDLLASIYKLSNCPEVELKMDNSKAQEQMIYFATNQRTFSYQELQQTMAMFAQHFQHERLQHGLHGLYPIHKDYCEAISLIFRSFAYSLIVSSVHAYPGVLADNCKCAFIICLLKANSLIIYMFNPIPNLTIVIDSLWPSICEMFSPWLIPYYTQNMQNTPANWIRQVIANTPILLPWSENYAANAQLLFHSFIDCVQFLLNTFPACDMILGNILTWYEMHFGNVAVPRHIFSPTNSSLMMLPWNRLRPTPLHILGFYRLLQHVSSTHRCSPHETVVLLMLFMISLLFVTVSARLSFVHRLHFPTYHMDTVVTLQSDHMGLQYTLASDVHLVDNVCEIVVRAAGT